MKNKYIQELDNIKVDSSFKQEMIKKMENHKNNKLDFSNLYVKCSLGCICICLIILCVFTYNIYDNSKYNRQVLEYMESIIKKNDILMYRNDQPLDNRNYGDIYYPNAVDFGGGFGLGATISIKSVDDLGIDDPYLPNSNVKLPIFYNSYPRNAAGDPLYQKPIQERIEILKDYASKFDLNEYDINYVDSSMIIFENEKMSISIENSDVVYVKFNENELKEDIYKIKGDSKNDVLDNVKKLIDYKPEWFVENPQIIISTDYDFDGNSNYEIVLKQSDIDNYSMHLKNNVSMKLYYDDNGYFYAIRYYINEEKEIVDEFPIISLNKAILEARQGNMYNISGMELDTRNILKVELVYICLMPYEYYLPYYKFYMACLNEKDESNVEGCRNVGIAYVPAISSEYIESKEIVFQ